LHDDLERPQRISWQPKVGDRVIVWAAGHPHEGMTGEITEFFGIVMRSGNPGAMIKRDDGKGFNVISLRWLLPQSEAEKNPEKPVFTKQEYTRRRDRR